MWRPDQETLISKLLPSKPRKVQLTFCTISKRAAEFSTSRTLRFTLQRDSLFVAHSENCWLFVGRLSNMPRSCVIITENYRLSDVSKFLSKSGEEDRRNNKSVLSDGSIVARRFACGTRKR